MSGNGPVLGPSRTSDRLDTDFPGEQRQLVKEYMENRFGATQVCSLGTYTTLQIKAALSDLCRLEGVPIQEVRHITAKFGEEKEKSMEDFLKTVSGSEELRKFVIKYSDVVNDVFIVLGAPKAASIHACGTVILPDEKTQYEWIPVRKQKDMIISEWEGGEMESAGFLKEDILGIAQLDKFRDIIDLIEEHTGKRLDLYKDIPLDDPKVYEAMGNGFLGNIFHFGAKGLSSYTVQVKPKSIDELSLCAALYRPGCIENNFHNEYILRRSGEREVEYPIGADGILKETQGLAIFQENIMFMCQHLGGFSLQEADDVRKAMGHKKAEILNKFETKFVNGYKERFAVTEEYAKNLWGQMIEFAKYGFNKSHAVAYSINGYNSMWLKVHYPIEFWSVTFSRAKMDEFPFYLNEIKNSGDIEIKPVNINKSQINIVADPSTNSMYWAINSVDQVGEKAQAQLIEERNLCGEYFSLEEFIDRQMGTGSAINKSVVENLIYSGAFDEVEQLTSIQERGRLLKQFREIRKVKVDPKKDEYTLACKKGKQDTDWWWRLQQKKKSGFAYFDYDILVEQYLRKNIGKEWTFVTGDQIRDWSERNSGYKVCVGGYVIEMQERKSKKGNFCNLVLECNYEFIKVLVFPELFEEYQDFLRDCKDSLLLLNGNIIYNKFHDTFVLQTSQSTEFVKVSNI